MMIGDLNRDLKKKVTNHRFGEELKIKEICGKIEKYILILEQK